MDSRRRPADWPLLLAAVIADAERRPFAWGRHDCCTWAADVVLAITMQDPLADLRGRWSTADEAAALLAELGGLQQAVTDRLGQPMPYPALVQRGDVVMVAADPAATGGMRHALAVCGGHVLLGPGLRGLARVPMFGDGPSPALVAWRV